MWLKFKCNKTSYHFDLRAFKCTSYLFAIAFNASFLNCCLLLNAVAVAICWRFKRVDARKPSIKLIIHYNLKSTPHDMWLRLLLPYGLCMSNDRIFNCSCIYYNHSLDVNTINSWPRAIYLLHSATYFFCVSFLRSFQIAIYYVMAINLMWIMKWKLYTTWTRIGFTFLPFVYLWQ